MKSYITGAWRLFVAGCVAGSLLLPNVAAAEQPVTKAVWRVQDIYFHYVGFTTLYSCDGLRDRMREFLAQLGAHESALVNTSACSDFSQPTRYTSVRIVFAHPVEATDDNIKAIGQDEKREKLWALLQKHNKGTEIGTEPFEAEKMQVTLLSRAQSPTSAAGDCELLEQIRDRLIKPMGGAVMKDDLRCVPYQGTAGSSNLKVQMLSVKRS